MKRTMYILLVAGLLIAVSGVVWGQEVLSENFETGLPTSYTTATSFTLSSGIWTGSSEQIEQATEGVKSGSYSCKLRSQTGSQITTPTLENGVKTISFYVTASTESGGMQIRISTDNGENWTQVEGSPISIDTIITYYSFDITNTSVNKVQFYRTGATVFLDDISIIGYSDFIQPSIGDIYISEYSDASGTGNYIYEFIELFNNSESSINLSNCVLKQIESTTDIIVPEGIIIPSKGFLVIGRNSSKSEFENYWSISFPDNVIYISGNSSFPIMNGDEKYLIEDKVGNNIDPSPDDEYSHLAINSGERVYRLSVGNNADDWTTGIESEATPGQLEPSGDQSLSVELNGFNAIPGDGEVMLCWTTESETENLGFIIQRRHETACLTAQSRQGEWKQVVDYTTCEALQGQGSTSEAHEYSYTDAAVVPGAIYFYRLGDVDYAGKITWLKELEVTLPENGNAVPAKFTLHKAYPNPFNPETTFKFELGEAADVHVRVYDLLGNLVTTLTNSHYRVGQYSLYWDGRDNRGRLLSSGIYFLNISSTTGFTNTQKVIFLR